MRYHGVELICPACRSELTPSQDSVTGIARNATPGHADAEQPLHCVSCRRTYPVILGIPDLRLWPDPYISLEDDRAKARMLAAECSGLSFADSVELYYRVTSAVPPFQARRFARSLLAATSRCDATLQELERRTGSRPDGALLDVGCGTAPLLVPLVRRGEVAAGVDIALRWLVMAQKRLEENDLSVPLVCACAEALPFTSGAFTRVVADATVEHLRDQVAGLSECHRVMRPGGYIFIATPNRRSVGPDPHTGLPGGGWLPEPLNAAYVRWKGGVPPRRRLLTEKTLRGLLENAGFEIALVDAPDVPTAQRAGFGALTRFAIDIYHFVKRLPGGGGMLRKLGPLLHAAARKPSGSSHSSPAASSERKRTESVMG